MKRQKKAPDFLVDRIRDILMKRYAVEKVIELPQLICIFFLALLSFVLFQVFWVICTVFIGNFWKIIVEIGVIFCLALCWRKAWKIIGEIIPKFVWIGLLGWFFIAANIIPNLVISNSWQLNEGNIQESKAGSDKNHETKTGKTSISIPITRFFNFNEKKNAPIDVEKAKQITLSNYLETFIAPFNMLDEKDRREIEAPDSNILKLCRYALLLLGFVLFLDIFFSVSIYKQYEKENRFYSFFSIPAAKREKDIKRKLVLFSIVLLIFSAVSFNYFVLFWVLSFLTTIFIFRWEIQQRGQNHKPLSRSVLFVFLTLVFSSISGEILLLTLFPVYTLMSGKIPVFHPYDTIVLGWTVLLGASVTVLLGIVTQVIWSGRRMTEKLKD
jgi:hypothetical protein